MGRRKWSRADVARLIQMRDVQKLKWPVIGAAFGVPAAVCASRYHYISPAGEPTAPASARPLSPELPPKPARRPEPVIHRPRYFHEADADIAARIRRQGLTAGFLGDPPPGRSALDQRRG